MNCPLKPCIDCARTERLADESRCICPDMRSIDIHAELLNSLSSDPIIYDESGFSSGAGRVGV